MRGVSVILTLAEAAARSDIIARAHFPARAGLIYDKLNRLDLLHPHFTLEQLHTIAVPTLVMAGDRDIVIDTHTLALFHALPRAELCIVPGAHHGFFFEKPPLANGIIEQFLLAPYADTK